MLKKLIYLILIIIIFIYGFSIHKDILKDSDIRTVKIGIVAPFSGDASSYGFNILKGVELAKKQQNSISIDLITEDSQCDPQKSPDAIKKLLEKNVIAIIGDVCSSPTLSDLPVIDQEKVVLISPSSTSPELSNKSKYFFRTVPSDLEQGKLAAKIIYKQGIRRLIIFHTNESYGNSLFNIVGQEFINLGGNVVKEFSFERDTTVFDSSIKIIGNLNADGLYLASNSPTSSVAIIRSLQTANIKIPIIGSESLADNSLLKQTGMSAEGLLVTALSSGNIEFLNSHKQEFGIEAGPFAAQGYDAMNVILNLVKKGFYKREEIYKNITSTNFLGASGEIVFNENNEVGPNYEVLIVSKGEFKKINY